MSEGAVVEEQHEALLGFKTPTCELAIEYQRGSGGGQERGHGAQLDQPLGRQV